MQESKLRRTNCSNVTQLTTMQRGLIYWKEEFIRPRYLLSMQKKDAKNNIISFESKLHHIF